MDPKVATKKATKMAPRGKSKSASNKAKTRAARLATCVGKPGGLLFIAELRA